MNTFDLNIKKCQNQLISCSESLANSRRWMNHYFWSSKKEDQKLYETYCELVKQDKKALEEANKKLEKAYETKTSS